MIVLLDADTCSYLRRGIPSVIDQYRTHVAEGVTVGISSITLFEMQFGLATKQPRVDVQTFLTELVQNVKVFPFGVEAAQQAASIRARQVGLGRPTGAYDPLLAGHAISLNAQFVTNNTRHFQEIPGLLLGNWLS